MSYRLTLATLLALPLIVFAADDPKPLDREKLLAGTPEAFIKTFDKNSDGVLDKDELPMPLVRLMEKADRNSDGKLDKAEVEMMQKALRERQGANPPAGTDADKSIARILEQLDGNKDGKISKDEAKGPLAENFGRVDKNSDGFLDKEELKVIAGRLANPGGQPGNPGRPMPPSGPEFDPNDKDADGRITKDEAKGTPLADKFEEIDANKDGKIDRKEFDAFLRKAK